MFVCVQMERRYAGCVRRLRGMEHWSHVRPAFTCDLWKAATGIEYFTATAHYVKVRQAATSTLAGGGEQWELKSRVLCTVPVHEPSITGDGELGNMARSCTVVAVC